MRIQFESWIKRFLGLFALLAFLLITFAQIQSWVLCFEPDGRIALETSVNGFCSDSVQEAQNQKTTLITSKKASLISSSCKRCVDVPLSIANAEFHESPLPYSPGPVHMPMMTQAPGIPIGFLATVTENQLPQPPPPLRPAIHAILNTVILLI